MRNCIFSKIGFGLKTNKERGKKGNCKRGTRTEGPASLNA
jgi:hypothetical protein